MTMEKPYGTLKTFDLKDKFHFEEAGEAGDREKKVKEHHLLAHLIGITEEGYDKANWFKFGIYYPEELGGYLIKETAIPGYARLSKGSEDINLLETTFKKFCKRNGFQMSEIKDEAAKSYIQTQWNKLKNMLKN
jgi:hypothetical protein